MDDSARQPQASVRHDVRTRLVLSCQEEAAGDSPREVTRVEYRLPRRLGDGRRFGIGVLLALVLLVAASLRLPRLNRVPVFVDEDAYTTSAMVMRRLPLGEAVFYPAGHKPTLALLTQAYLGSALDNYVLAGRLQSALAGIVTTLLAFYLGRRLAGVGVGLVTALLYAVVPIAILHERMVLQDGLLTLVSLAFFLGAWKAVEGSSWRLGLGTAALGFLAVQFKLSGTVATPLALVLWLLVGRRRLSALGPAVVGSLGQPVSHLLLMLSPLGPALSVQSGDRLKLFAAMPGNLLTLSDTLRSYYPHGLLVLVALGVLVGLREHTAKTLVFLAAVVLWSTPWIVLSNFAPSRYFLPAAPFQCALAALAMVRLGSLAGRLAGSPARAVAVAGCVLVVLLTARSASGLVLRHARARLSSLDDWQYRSGWPSGYGYGEAARFLRERVEPGAGVVYVIDDQHSIALRRYEPLPRGAQVLGTLSPDQVLPDSPGGILYVLVDDGRDPFPGARLAKVLEREPRLRELARFTRPRAEIGISVLRLP